MAQHDYIISNQTFPNTRADINNVLSAIASNNSGTSAPTTQYAGQFWIDTTSSTWTLYIHDGSDDIQFATIDTSANTVNFVDSALDVVTDTSPQLGGNLDLNSNDITGTGNINITGTGTFSGDLTVDTSTLKVDSTNNRVGIGTSSPATNLHISSTGTPVFRIQDADGSDYYAQISQATGNTLFDTRFGASNGAFIFRGLGGGVADEYMRIDSSGNLLVGTTSVGFTDTGAELRATGQASLTVDGNACAYMNRLTSDGRIIEFYKDDTTVGNINAEGGDIAIGTGAVGLQFFDSGNAIRPFSITANHWIDNTIDIGRSVNRFKDLYLGGGLYVGGTGSANKLDDYEEGTFTPTILGDTTAGTGTYSLQSGAYTKIGNTVTVAGKIAWSAHTGTGLMKMGGLPFTTNSVANHQSSLVMSEIGNITITANNILVAHTIQNTTEVFFGRTPVGGGGDGAVTLDTAGYFRFSTTYQTA